MSSTIGAGESRNSKLNLKGRIDNDYFNSDLVFNAVASGLIGTVGYMLSWINPTTLPTIVKGFESNNYFRGSYSAAGLIYAASLTGGYLLGTYHNIERIVEEPTAWTSYIPVVTNTVAGGIMAINHLVKRKKQKKDDSFKIENVMTL